MTLGNRIKELRKKYNMNQQELGKKIGLSFGTISKYEKDEISIPSENLCKIADVFNVSTDYLLGRSDSSPLPIAASTKNNLDLSDISDEDKKAIERFIEMAKNRKN